MAEQPLRVAEFDELFADALRGAERFEPGWLRLRLAPGAETAARTRELLARESRCCTFFTFDVTATDGVLLVDVRVPAAHTAVLDGLERRAGNAEAPRPRPVPRS